MNDNLVEINEKLERVIQLLQKKHATIAEHVNGADELISLADKMLNVCDKQHEQTEKLKRAIEILKKVKQEEINKAFIEAINAVNELKKTGNEKFAEARKQLTEK